MIKRETLPRLLVEYPFQPATAIYQTVEVLLLAGRLFYGNEEVFDRFGRAVESRMPPEGVSANDALEVLKMQHEVLERQIRLA